jgi:hypothetical protein
MGLYLVEVGRIERPESTLLRRSITLRAMTAVGHARRFVGPLPEARSAPTAQTRPQK